MNLEWGAHKLKANTGSTYGAGSSHSTHSVFGPVKNVKGDRTDPVSAGGSSGGSAIAVATGQCFA